MSDDLYQEALEEFGRRLRRGRDEALILQPTAMTLATADDRGRPSSRTVLLKDFGRDGFVFYTNRESRKGEQLSANSWASLCFYWDPYWEQAVVEGPVQEVSPVEADLYWVTRSWISQVGAWASKQSRPLASRDQLISEVTAYEKKYQGSTVPRPEHWSGFRVIPHRIEFWTGRSFRLNDRRLYEKTGQGWTVKRLYP